MNTKHVHCQISSNRQNMSMPLSRNHITKNTMVDNRKSVNLKKNKSANVSSSSPNKKASEISSTNQITSNKQEEQQLDPLFQLTLLLTLIGSSSSSQ